MSVQGEMKNDLNLLTWMKWVTPQVCVAVL